MVCPDCGITLRHKGTLSVEYRRTQPAAHSAGGRTAPAQQAVAYWNRLSTHAAAFSQNRSRRFDTLDPALRAIRTFGDGPEDGVEMRIGLRLPSGTDVPALQKQMQTWRNSDMNVVGPAWGGPVVAYGPGNSSLDHTPDEHIDIEGFRQGVEVLA